MTANWTDWLGTVIAWLGGASHWSYTYGSSFPNITKAAWKEAKVNLVTNEATFNLEWNREVRHDTLVLADIIDSLIIQWKILICSLNVWKG